MKHRGNTRHPSKFGGRAGGEEFNQQIRDMSHARAASRLELDYEGVEAARTGRSPRVRPLKRGHAEEQGIMPPLPEQMGQERTGATHE